LASSIYFTYPFVGEATFYLYTIGGTFLGRAKRYSSIKKDVAIEIAIVKGDLKSGAYLLVVQHQGIIASNKFMIIK